MTSGRGGKRGGAGRPATGRTTKVLRVPLDVTAEEIAAIPSLKNAIADWEAECSKNPDNPRHYFLKQMIEEIRGLGY